MTQKLVGSEFIQVSTNMFMHETISIRNKTQCQTRKSQMVTMNCLAGKTEIMISTSMQERSHGM